MHRPAMGSAASAANIKRYAILATPTLFQEGPPQMLLMQTAEAVPVVSPFPQISSHP
jgi:hypothetical protein